MIKLENLSKSYRDKLVLDKISSNFEKGKIYGLLGRNGAGKTTLLRILSNQIVNFEGVVSLDGSQIIENQDLTEKILLVTPNMIPSTFDTESIRSIYKWASMLLRNWDEDYKERLVKEFKLDVKSKFNKLSQGNKNLVTLILGLASNAEIIFFDEPSTGLDANNRYKFYKILLEDMEEKERYCIISTHIIDEAEKIFEEVKILENNRFILEENISTIQEKALILTGKEEDLRQVIESKNILDQSSLGGLKLVSIFDDLSEQEKEELRLANVDIKPIPLQDFFVLITEKEAK